MRGGVRWFCRVLVGSLEVTGIGDRDLKSPPESKFYAISSGFPQKHECALMIADVQGLAFTQQDILTRASVPIPRVLTSN